MAGVASSVAVAEAMAASPLSAGVACVEGASASEGRRGAAVAFVIALVIGAWPPTTSADVAAAAAAAATGTALRAAAGSLEELSTAAAEARCAGAGAGPAEAAAEAAAEALIEAARARQPAEAR